MSKKWLVVKASGGGGLGDSIKSVLTAALYAKLSKRVLVVDWCGGVYSDANENPFDRLFVIKTIDARSKLPDSDDVFPDAWKGRLGKSLHEVYSEDGWQQWDRARTIGQYSFDMSKLDYPHEVLVMWEFDQISKLNRSLASPTPDVMGIYRSVAAQCLGFSDEFKFKLDPLLAKFQSPMVGVHVRATGEFDQNKGSLALKHYFRTVDKLMKPGVGLFLATDNIDIQAQFTKRYAAVYTTEKWFATPGDSLHMNPACPDKFTGLVEALLEMVLLSKCDSIVVTPGSSFSAVAQIFADQSVVIIDPGAKSLVEKITSLLKQILRLA